MTSTDNCLNTEADNYLYLTQLHQLTFLCVSGNNLWDDAGVLQLTSMTRLHVRVGTAC